MNEYLKNNQLLHKLHGLNYVYAETLVDICGPIGVKTYRQ